jgi:hypothetical protein
MPLTEAQTQSLADAVVAFLGVEPDDDVKLRAFHQVGVVVTLTKAYTRGVGFSEGEDGHLIIAEALQGVIITATARLVTNPAQSLSQSESVPLLRVGVGGQPVALNAGKDLGHNYQGPVLGVESFAFTGGFTGFTDVEKAVLHQFRVRNG